MADRRDNAVATAQSYHQGNIAGLDDAMTRRLIASTVMTESNGGDLAITNRQGYTGRYQAGAGWLADAGYVDADKLREAMKGYRSEWAWASQGHMTEFLNDPGNWQHGLSVAQYKGSAELQDQAFKINSDKAYQQAIKTGVLHEDDSPAKVAGFLKARHIAGQGGATAAVTGGRVIRDSNGTSNYDYLHDITRNRDGLDQRMGRGVSQSAPAATRETGAHAQSTHGVLLQGAHGAAVSALQSDLHKLGYTDAHGHPLKIDGDFGPDTRYAVEKFQAEHDLLRDGKVGRDTRAALHTAALANVVPGLDDNRNPDHTMYEQALAGVKKIDADMGRPSDQHSANLAAALAVAAKAQGLTGIDDIAISKDGSRTFAVQDALPLPRLADVSTALAVHTSIEHSSAAARAIEVGPVTTASPHQPSLQQTSQPIVQTLSR
jgi:peptidoglycan hydrolase-like protein with peptidoglycan-binding domain